MPPALQLLLQQLPHPQHSKRQQWRKQLQCSTDLAKQPLSTKLRQIVRCCVIISGSGSGNCASRRVDDGTASTATGGCFVTGRADTFCPAAGVAASGVVCSLPQTLGWCIRRQIANHEGDARLVLPTVQPRSSRQRGSWWGGL